MLPMLTATVVTAWVVVAVLLYREYRSNLLANLRGRTLDINVLHDRNPPYVLLSDGGGPMYWPGGRDLGAELRAVLAQL